MELAATDGTGTMADHHRDALLTEDESIRCADGRETDGDTTRGMVSAENTNMKRAK